MGFKRRLNSRMDDIFKMSMQIHFYIQAYILNTHNLQIFNLHKCTRLHNIKTKEYKVTGKGT